MNKFSIYSKTVWLPFALLVAVLSFGATHASAQQIQWQQDLAKAKAEARDTNRLVWLHFAADWCVPCKKLESFVFTNTSVIRAADRNTVAVKIDADAQASLVKQLAVPRIPYDIMMTPSGRVIVNRPSPKNSSDFLKMLNRLDRPLQGLSSGDREVINAEIDQLNNVIQRSGGLNQQKTDLDLNGPSHEMAATTVEGQRLERGFESSKRVSGIRQIEAQRLKQKAAIYIAEQESKKGQGPKVSENPFFKSANSSSKVQNFGNQSQTVTTGTPKIVSNAFVTQNKPSQLQSIKDDSAFVPPTFEDKPLEKLAVEASDSLSLIDERQEFSFSSPADKKASVSTQKAETKPIVSLSSPKLTLPMPKFADQTQTPKQAGSNDFAYAPIGNLRQALRSESKPITPKETSTAIKSFQNPINKSLQKPPTTETSRLSFSPPQLPTTSTKPSAVKRPSVPDNRVATYAEFERPTMKTDVSIPQAPAMVKGVVKIAETMVPAVEGRLVAAEQSISDRPMVRTYQSPSPVQRQMSPTDELLANVDFFAQDKQPVQVAPRAVAAPRQQTPQPQIVINLNTGKAAGPQTTQPVSQGVVIQPNYSAQGVPSTTVALASSNAASANRATVPKADIASAVRSKYALKGKCPVTLLSEGRWINGNKKIGCVHRDRVYLFASAAHREAFLADPDRLSPLLAGFDPVVFEETGKLVEGDEKFGTFMGKKPNQRIVLFKTADTRERFQNEPSKYLNVVRKAMTDKGPKDTKLR